MITSLRLVDFKNFSDETLRVGPFTVIVGANASGKSNIRDALWTCNPGGYQARKKSLSLRECSILDHSPSSEEAKHGTDTVRWFARILVMLPVRPT